MSHLSVVSVVASKDLQHKQHIERVLHGREQVDAKDDRKGGKRKLLIVFVFKFERHWHNLGLGRALGDAELLDCDKDVCHLSGKSIIHNKFRTSSTARDAVPLTFRMVQSLLCQHQTSETTVHARSTLAPS